MKLVRHPYQIQQLTGDKISDFVDCSGIEIEAWIGRGEDRSGVVEDLVVVDVHRREGHLAMYEDQAAALLERDGGGAGDQIAPQSMRRFRQGVAGAGDDHHAVVKEAAAGKLAANVVVVVEGDGVLGRAGECRQINRFHPQLIMQQPATQGRDNQVRVDACSHEALQKALGI